MVGYSKDYSGKSRVPRWWENDMAQASQSLYRAPDMALQAATMPNDLLPQSEMMPGTRPSQPEKKGFFSAIGDFASAVFGSGEGVADTWDSVIANTPTWVKKPLEVAWYPIDKLAQGAHWLYKEGVSQPFSTLLIQAAKTEYGGGWSDMFSASEWADAYGEAETQSIGQTMVNYENVKEAMGDRTLLGGIFGVLAGGADDLTEVERQEIRRNSERFLYDSNFWRSKDEEAYKWGTGALDAFFAIAADPTMFLTGGIGAGIKAARSVKLAEGAETAAAVAGKTSALKGERRFEMPIEKLGRKVGEAMAPKPVAVGEAVRSKQMNEFFDWIAAGTNGNRTSVEIAQHPIWGRSRRKNHQHQAASAILASTPREKMGDVFRFAGGDNAAAAKLANEAEDVLAQAARAADHRHILDSARYDDEILALYAERTGAVAPGAPGAAMPSAESLLAGAPDAGFVQQARSWREARLAEADMELAALNKEESFYKGLFGTEGIAAIETGGAAAFSAADSALFGTMKSLYRMGPAALRSTEKAAEAKFGRLMGAHKDGGIAHRYIRNGYYSIPIRIAEFFGERLPEKFINHVEPDAAERVALMLKGVPGMDSAVRTELVQAYARAGDKVERSNILEAIHTQVIEHMAGNVHKLDPEVAMVLNRMRVDGFSSTMRELTGAKPTSQRFSTAEYTTQGGQTVRADKVDVDGAWIVGPKAKTQLQSAEPLLDVRLLDKVLSRHSGPMQGLRGTKGKMTDYAISLADEFNTVWKGMALLRGGYAIRSSSDEVIASAMKFGILSSIIGGTQGARNIAHNRTVQLRAHITGGTSYGSAIGGGARITLEDANLPSKLAEAGLGTTKVKVSSALPVAQGVLSMERELLKKAQENLAKMERAIAEGRTIDEGVLLSAREGVASHESAIEEFTDYIHDIIRGAKDAKGRRIGEGTFHYDGMEIPQAFAKEWAHPIDRATLSGDRAQEVIFARANELHKGRAIATGSWKELTPDLPEHMASWLRVLNHQMGQDDLWRLIAQDASLETARAWLKTAQGRAHRADLGAWGRDPEDLLNALKADMDHLLPEGTGLRAKLANGEEIYEHELRAAISQSDFPTVHGEEIAAKSRFWSMTGAHDRIHDTIALGYHYLGSVPSEVMSRHPVYLRFQESHMRNLIEQEKSYLASQGLDEVIDTRTLNSMLKKSDDMARKDMRQVVYDPVRTRATEALRFVAPFFSAHGDSLARWAGLIAERPQLLSTAAKIYNAPVAANLITDSSGNAVGLDGMVDVRNEKGEIVERKLVPMSERMITLRMPWEATEKGKAGIVPDAGGTRIKLSAINTIMPGDPWFNPGTGPLVQIPASVIAKKAPSYGDFLQMTKVIPYGPSENWHNAVTPKWVRAAYDAFTTADPDNEAYQKAYLGEYQRQVAEWKSGGEPPNMAEVEKNARNFMFLEIVTAWASPAQTAHDSTLTGSPYQFYLDQYRQLQKVDHKNARERFMATYGADYAVFTASLSKSQGIAATIQADAAAERYGAHVAANPEFGGLILGDSYNTGSLSSSVYRKQMETMMPGGGGPMREKISALEAIKQSQVEVGWSKYNKGMEIINSALLREGYHSFSESGAERYQQLKLEFKEKMAQSNPAWFQDFSQQDTGKQQRTINVLTLMAQDPNIMNDPLRSEMVAVKNYLMLRSILKRQLNERGFQSLSFDPLGNPMGENEDLGHILREQQTALVNSNTKFGPLFSRYLERDDLS